MASQNPYVGPAPIAEGTVLYGRDDEKRDLYHLLLNERIILLYSPPGAGKTSLIQAGLMPQLRRDRALRLFLIDGLAEGEAGAGLGIANRYLASLVGQVENALSQDQRGRFDWHAPRASLRDYLDSVRGGGAEADRRHGEVLLLDHFEDLLLDPYDRQDKQAFFRELGQALTDRNRQALFSMGERQIAELDEYLHLIPTGLARRFRLGLLGRRQARQAIKGPAVLYEPRALAGLMLKLRMSIDSRGAGGSRRQVLSEWVEPVQLQIACQRLWATRFAAPAEATGSIRASDVKAFSVESALEDYYADTAKAAALAAPPTTERDVREWIERRLILPSGARGQAPRADTAGLVLPGPATQVLTKEQLVRLQMLGDSRWYELAYDRLVEPIRRSNQRWFANLEPLQRKAREWDRRERPDRMLLSVSEFRAGWGWRRAHDSELRPEERDFWHRSWRSLLYFRLIPAIGALTVVVLGCWVWVSMRQAEVERSARVQQQMLVKLGNAKEQALQRSLDSALIDGALTATTVAGLPSNETLEFAVRESLISVLRTARNVRKVIVHDDARLKAVAVQPGRADPLFAYGGTGGKVWLANANGLLPGNYAVACSAQQDVKSLAFNAQGTLLALGCEDGTVSVWSTSSWERRGEWKAHPRRTLTVAFDRRGTAVASGGEGDENDNTIQIMPITPDGTPALATPTRLKASLDGAVQPIGYSQTIGFAGGVWSIAFSPTEDILAVGDGVGALWLCDLGKNGKCDLKQPGRPALSKEAVIAVAFSEDGACLATGSDKGNVKLWNLPLASSGENVPTDETPAYSLTFAKRNDARQLAIGKSTRLRFVRLAENTCSVDKGAAAGPSAAVVGDEVTGLAFHEAKGLLAVTTAMGYLALIEVDGPNDRVRLPSLSEQQGMPARNGNGWRGALAADDPTAPRFVVGRADDDRLFVVRLGKDGWSRVVESVPSEQTGVRRVTASVESKRVATLGQDGTIKFWILDAQLVTDSRVQPLANPIKLANEAAARNGTQSLQFPNIPDDPKKMPTRILLSPNGDLLACLFNIGILMVNLADPSASKWEPTETATSEIAFSSDGTWFAAGGNPLVPGKQEVPIQEVQVWSVRSGQLHAQVTKQPMRLTPLAGGLSELALAIPRGGKAVAIAGGANGQILVWNAQTGVPVQTMRAGSRQIQQMAFLQDKNLLAAADEYGQVTLWDVGDWRQVELTTRLDKIQKTRFLSFASHSGILVSGTDDLMVWDIDVRSLRSKICEILAVGNGASASKRVAAACPPP